jgi:hypothetical protein
LYCTGGGPSLGGSGNNGSSAFFFRRKNDDVDGLDVGRSERIEGDGWGTGKVSIGRSLCRREGARSKLAEVGRDCPALQVLNDFRSPVETLLDVLSLNFLLYDFERLEKGLKLRLSDTSLTLEYATMGASKPACVSLVHRSLKRALVRSIPGAPDGDGALEPSCSLLCSSRNRVESCGSEACRIRRRAKSGRTRCVGPCCDCGLDARLCRDVRRVSSATAGAKDVLRATLIFC